MHLISRKAQTVRILGRSFADHPRVLKLKARPGFNHAYRLVSSHARELPPSKGAVSSTILRLERQSASLGEIARWPGMSMERASRLLNALYLCGALMVTRIGT